MYLLHKRFPHNGHEQLLLGWLSRAWLLLLLQSQLEQLELDPPLRVARLVKGAL